MLLGFEEFSSDVSPASGKLDEIGMRWGQSNVQRFFIKNNLFFEIFLFKITVDHSEAEGYLQSVTTGIRNNADAAGLNDSVQRIE